MKRVIAAVIVLVIALGLCACGRGEADPGKAGPAPGDSGPAFLPAEEWEVPTEEELGELDRYSEIVLALHRYADGIMWVDAPDESGNYTRYENQEALRYCYEQLLQLESVDKWIAAGFVPDGLEDPAVNRNRMELLDRIHVIGDVLTEQRDVRTDAVGNVICDVLTQYQYDQNGNMIYTDSTKNNGCFWPSLGWSVANVINLDMRFEYGEDGRVSKMRCLSGNNVDTAYLITPEYGSDGRVLRDTVTYTDGSTWDYVYAYDAEGRLVSVTADNERGGKGYNWAWQYSYDAAGNLVKVEKLDNQFDSRVYSTIEYTYREDGRQIEGVYSDVGSYTESYTITLDEQGRILTWKQVRSDLTIQLERVYGDYYVFAPAG